MMGLANRAVSSEQLADAVYAYAREMVRFCSSAAMKAMKAQVYKVPFETLAESVHAANQFMAVMNSSEGFREGTRSFLEKRTHNFPPLKQTKSPSQKASPAIERPEKQR